MEAHWDLDSVLEQCCSKLHNEDLLPPLNGNGDFGWLDEKADLSAWTELDFPDELAGGTLGNQATSAHPSAFEPKLQSPLPSNSSRSPSWCGDPFSPALPSPPESPPNSSPFVAPSGSQLEELQFSFEDAFVDAAARLSPALGSGLSPPPTPHREVTLATTAVVDLKASQTNACDSQLSVPIPSQQDATPIADGAVAYEVEMADVSSPSTVQSETEVELVVIENVQDSDDYEPEKIVPSEEVTEVAAKQKRKKRGPRKSTGESTRKERKRLQNKDAATRYRQKKKMESENMASEYEEQCEINRDLKKEAERISSEISYLKGLMRELLKKKGLLQ